MKEILPFTFPTTGQAVRTLLLDGEPWFVAADVTDILGYVNGRAALARHVDEEDRRDFRRSEAVADRYPFDDLRIQSVSLINESGLFSLILRSEILGAREFKRWVTFEVLPAIRKTGSYALPREYSRLELIELARESELARIDAENRATQAELQAMELAPAARAWDELMEGHGDYDVAQAAQILKRDPAIDTGQRRLFDYMASLGWIYRKHGRWTPYQTQVDNGRLLLKPQKHRHPEDDQVLIIDAPQVRVTVKGLGELHKRLGGRSQLQALVSEEVLVA